MATLFHDGAPPAIAPGLFFEDGPPSDRVQLRGGRHRETGRILFPYPDHEEGAFEPAALAREGVLWSFTVQRFRPKSPPYDGPAAFTPYAVGYVELPGQLIIESRLVGIPFAELRIGMAVQLTLEPFVTAAGVHHVTFAFTTADMTND